MERPSTIILNGEEWRVVFGEYKNRRGYCWPKRRLIGIDKRLSPLRKTEVLLHEMIHGNCDWMDEYYVQEHAKDYARALLEFGLLSPECEP